MLSVVPGDLQRIATLIAAQVLVATTATPPTGSKLEGWGSARSARS